MDLVLIPYVDQGRERSMVDSMVAHTERSLELGCAASQARFLVVVAQGGRVEVTGAHRGRGSTARRWNATNSSEWWWLVGLDGEALRAMRRGASAGKSCDGAAARSGCSFIRSKAREAGAWESETSLVCGLQWRRYLGGEARAAQVWEWKRSRRKAPF
jgi:hypothetical protein